MKRFSGHREPWGTFVDAKVNAPQLLRAEIQKKKMGKVWVSGVCDPYQPLERRYCLTRECLRILIQGGWSVAVQTRSPLVLRDLDVLTAANNPEADVEVGLTITTADDSIRRLFEPHAPPIGERFKALARLHEAGVKTFAMIAPLLPGAEELGDMLADKVDYVLVDRMNYTYGAWVYRKHGLRDKLSDGFFRPAAGDIASALARAGVPCHVVF
jgi:DNA repair photolyase